MSEQASPNNKLTLTRYYWGRYKPGQWIKISLYGSWYVNRHCDTDYSRKYRVVGPMSTITSKFIGESYRAIEVIELLEDGSTKYHQALPIYFFEIIEEIENIDDIKVTASALMNSDKPSVSLPSSIRDLIEKCMKYGLFSSNEELSA